MSNYTHKRINAWYYFFSNSNSPPIMYKPLKSIGETEIQHLLSILLGVSLRWNNFSVKALSRYVNVNHLEFSNKSILCRAIESVRVRYFLLRFGFSWNAFCNWRLLGVQEWLEERLVGVSENVQRKLCFILRVSGRIVLTVKIIKLVFSL